jgi:vacuolar-type H+-ATPase subunit I/STV1
MYNVVKHLHSINRWVVLALLLVATFGALVKWFGNKDYTAQDKKTALLAMTFTHIQLLLGLALLYLSPKVSFAEGWRDNEVYRYFGSAHLIMMIFAIVLITIGYSVAKRQSKPKTKFLITWTFYSLGLLTMLGGIPWGKYGAGMY